jgi:hypothetical protein
VGEGIPFLGFVVYPERRRLKRRKGIYFRRRLQRLVDRDTLMVSFPWISYGQRTGLD